MDRVESAHGLDREGFCGPDADVRGDLQQMPVGRGFAELAAESANLSDSRWSLALGPRECPLGLEELGRTERDLVPQCVARSSVNQALPRASGEPRRSRDIRRSIAAVEIKKSLCSSSRKPDRRCGEILLLGRRPGRSSLGESTHRKAEEGCRARCAACRARRWPRPDRDQKANPAFNLTEVRAQIVLQTLHTDSLDGLHGVNSSYG